MCFNAVPFMPYGCGCTPFMYRPMMFRPMPMMFYGGGCWGGYNRMFDYMTALSTLNLFGNIMTNAAQSFTGGGSLQSTNSSPYAPTVSGAEDRVLSREERQLERAQRREARREAKQEKIEARREEAIANGRDPDVKGLGFVGKVFPKWDTRHYAKKALGKDFILKTKKIAQELHCSTNDLLAVMNQESSLNPTAVNKTSGASGLIQFTPEVAKELGTSVEEIRKMTAEEQLPYVRKYLLSRKSRAGFMLNEKLTGADLYALVLAPGKAKGEIMYDSVKNSKAYSANRGLDFDGDGQISKSDLQTAVDNKQIEVVA